MATMTINVMGKHQGERIMAVIMQTVRDTGRYELDIKDRPEPKDLMAHKMVQYKILKSIIVRHFPKKSDCYEFTMGDNFAAANLKGAHKFIEEEEKRLNPSTLKNALMKLDKSNIFVAIIGAILGVLLTLIFT